MKQGDGYLIPPPPPPTFSTRYLSRRSGSGMKQGDGFRHPTRKVLNRTSPQSSPPSSPPTSTPPSLRLTSRTAVSHFIYAVLFLAISSSIPSASAGVFYWFTEGEDPNPKWLSSKPSGSVCKSWTECGRCNDGWVSYFDSSKYNYCSSCPSGKYSDISLTADDVSPPATCPAQANCRSSDCENGCHDLEYRPTVACKPCPAGKYSAGGTQGCVVCPPGEYSYENADECTYCQSGKYIAERETTAAAHAGPQSCQGCAGEISSCSNFWGTKGCSVCNDCVVGRYYDSSSEDCKVCPEGKYQDSVGKTECNDCARGKYNEDWFFLDADLHDSEADCHNCEAGKFQTDEGESSCQNCPSGTYSQSGQHQCQTCPDGTSSSSGSDECLSEDTGIWTDDFYWYNGQWHEDPAWWDTLDEHCAVYAKCAACDQFWDNNYLTCTQCKEHTEPKYVSLSTGCFNCATSDCSDSCPSEIIDECEVVCGPGRRRHETKNSCVQCTEGKYSAGDTTSCSACPSGSVPDGCDKSWFGWAAGDEGCKSCFTCPAGTYADAGASECKLCPAGKISKDGATYCYACESYQITTSCFDQGSFWGSERSGCSNCTDEMPPISAEYATCPDRFGRPDHCHYRYDASNPKNNRTASLNQTVYVDGCTKTLVCERYEEMVCVEEGYPSEGECIEHYSAMMIKLYQQNSFDRRGGDYSPFSRYAGSSCLSFSLCRQDEGWFLTEKHYEFACNECAEGYEPGGYVYIKHGLCNGRYPTMCREKEPRRGNFGVCPEGKDCHYWNNGRWVEDDKTPFAVSHHREFARTCEDYIVCESHAEGNNYYLACAECKTDDGSDFYEERVMLNGVNQKGVCASMKEGGIDIVDTCRFSDEDILRLIDREDDLSICPDHGEESRGCQYWYNDTWIPVKAGASSPFYGLCTQYAFCARLDGLMAIACVDCLEEDDAVLSTAPNMTILRRENMFVHDQHLCIDHPDLSYYGTCDKSEMFQHVDFEQCPGSRVRGVEWQQLNAQTRWWDTVHDFVGSYFLGLNDMSSKINSLHTVDGDSYYRKYLYNGAVALQFDPPDGGCACYSECFTEEDSMLQRPTPVYVCTECRPGYVPAKVASNTTGSRGFYFRDLEKDSCRHLNELTGGEFPTRCVKESIVDAGQYCPAKPGKCMSPTIPKIVIEIDSIRNLPPFDNINTDQGWFRRILDYYSGNTKLFHHVAGLALKGLWNLGGSFLSLFSSDSGASTVLPESVNQVLGQVGEAAGQIAESDAAQKAQTAGQAVIQETSGSVDNVVDASEENFGSFDIGNIQFPSYYVAVRAVGEHGWIPPKYSGIGTYSEEVGMFKVMSIGGDQLVWEQKLDYISGSKQYRDRANTIVFENVCPDTPIEFSVMDLDFSPVYVFNKIMVERSEITLSCDDVPDSDREFCEPVDREGEENVISFCHGGRWPTSGENKMIQHMSDAEKADKFKAAYKQASGAVTQAFDLFNKGKEIKANSDSSDSCNAQAFFNPARCLGEKEMKTQEEILADEQREADSLQELFDERTKTSLRFSIKYPCFQEGCADCFGAFYECSKCEIGYGLYKSCTEPGFVTKNNNASQGVSGAFKTSELGLRVTTTKKGKGAAILANLCQDDSVANTENIYWEISTLSARNLVIGVASQQVNLNQSLLLQEEQASGINFAFYFGRSHKDGIDNLLFGPSTSIHDEYMEGFTVNDVHSSYQEASYSNTRLRFALNQTSGDMWFGINDQWIIGKPSKRRRPMFTLPTDRVWFPAASTSDGPLADSADVDVRFHLRNVSFLFDVPDGFKAIEAETKQAAHSPGRCEICANGTISDGYGLCWPCPLGTWRSGDESECTLCGPGKFGGSEGCTDCAPGKYAPLTGAKECYDCGLGRAATAAGAVTCDLCQPGKYSNETGAETCRNCTQGRYSSTVNSATCTSCGNGHYCLEEGMTAQIECRSGTFSGTSAFGVQACTECEAGKYAANEKSTECEKCNSGNFCNETGTVTPHRCLERLKEYTPTTGAHEFCLECTSCKKGFQFDECTSAGPSCSECDAGKFGGDGIECSNCTRGKYNVDMAASQCKPCNNGNVCPDEGSKLMTRCEPGSYTPDDGNSYATCFPCPAGMKSVSGNRCEQCPSGRYSEAGSSSCDDCARGKFNDVVGSPSCALCPASTYNNSTGMPKCTKCPSGKFSNSQGSKECTECPPKSFSGEGSTDCSSCHALNCEPGQEVICDADNRECVDCLPGHFSAQGDACTACPVGKAATAVGSAFCTSCNLGKYSNEVGSSSCLRCASGTYTNGDNEYSSCIPCAPGRYSEDSMGASQCSPCSPGKYSNEGSSQCDSCPLGKISASESSTVCDDCTSGKYASTSGSTSCLNCGEGTHAADAGASDCDKCPVGTFSLSSATVCTPCLEGSYSDQPGSSSCKVCPETRYSVEQSSDCSICDVGYYSTAGEIDCQPCPVGASCAKPGTTVEDLDVNRGFWRSSRRSSNIVKCVNADACPGSAPASPSANGTNPLLQDAQNSANSSDSKVIEDRPSDCAAGYVGPLCLVCASGYSQSLTGGCNECPDSSGVAMSVAGYVLGIPLVLVLLYLLARKMAGGSLQEHVKRARTDRNHWGYSLRSKLKILASSWQIVGSLQDVLGLALPVIFAEFIATISNVVNLDYFSLLPLGCIVDTSFHNKLLVATLGPLLFYACAFGIFLFREAIRRERNAESSKEQITVGMLVSLLSITVYSRARPYIKEEDNSLAITSQWSIFFTFFSSLLYKFNRLEELALDGGIMVDDEAVLMGETNEGLMGVLLIIINMLGVALFVLQLLLRLTKKMKKLKHRHTGVIGGISGRDLRDEGAVEEYVKVLAQSGELEAGWTSMRNVHRFMKKLEKSSGDITKGEYRCSTGDGPVDQFRFVYSVRGSISDCKKFVMNLEGQEREGEVEHSILQNQGDVVTKYVALELPKGRAGWVEQSDAVYKVIQYDADFLLLQTINAKRRGGRTRADMLEAFQFREVKRGTTEVTYVSSCDFNAGLVGALMLGDVEFKVCLRFINNMISILENGCTEESKTTSEMTTTKAIQSKGAMGIVLGGGKNPMQRPSLQKHIKKVESFGHEKVKVQGGRKGKGKGKGKEKEKEKKQNLVRINTGGLLELNVKASGGDLTEGNAKGLLELKKTASGKVKVGIQELRKPSAVIPPPATAPPAAAKSPRESFIPPPPATLPPPRLSAIPPPPAVKLSPWARMFDAETNTVYYQHTQDPTKFSWDKPEDFVE
ncbi:hypothetical protein TrVE_jg8351 [Triparma verrucosa]|uniref:TNFR-Cys domain-containing protein n=1 Tax=Triparma verrucosa TaxID=1606542 RepID=A0A9W7C4L3_9STRA|nr:hypothetical protein TrVE_jg8351 [Triparma verrucosa]